MAKKKKKFIIPLIVLILIIAIASFFVVRTQFAGFGFSSMSISQVDLVSYYTPLDGKAWMVTFRQGGLAQKLVGELEPSDVSEKYDGTESTKYDFSLELEYEKQECQYEINLDYNEDPIYSDFRLVEWTGINIASCSKNAQSKCGSSDVIAGYYNVPLMCNAICAVKRTGAVGNFGSPEINQKFTVTTYRSDVKDASKSFQTLKAGDIKGEVGNNVYIIWNGNLNSGRECKDKDPYKPIYKDGRWNIISNTAYQNYKTYYANRINIEKDNDAEIYIDVMNSRSRSALQTVSFGDMSNPSSLTNALLIRTLQTPAQFPVITAYIKASWIGIYTPIGRPELSQPESACFGTSSDGKVKVKVKNIGKERDMFDVYGICSSPFVITDRVEVSLKPEESQYVTLSISADSDKKVEGSYCTIYAKGTQYTDSIKANVCVEPHVFCEVGEKACIEGNVGICNPTGTGYNLFKKCDYGCAYTNEGVPYCKEDIPPPPSCAWWDIKCHLNNIFKWTGNYFSVLIIVLSLFIAIIGGLFTYKELTERKLTNKKTSKIVGFLFGIGLGFLFYYYILVVIILLVLYVIYRIVLK